MERKSEEFGRTDVGCGGTTWYFLSVVDVALKNLEFVDGVLLREDVCSANEVS